MTTLGHPTINSISCFATLNWILLINIRVGPLLCIKGNPKLVGCKLESHRALFSGAFISSVELCSRKRDYYRRVTIKGILFSVEGRWWWQDLGWELRPSSREVEIGQCYYIVKMFFFSFIVNISLKRKLWICAWLTL